VLEELTVCSCLGPHVTPPLHHLVPPCLSLSVKHLPDVEAHRRAPFARPPPQSPLGEAARCGFDDICKLLLESGAPTELANSVGWTPLHEAAFYNHIKTVKVLLSFGANGSAPNGQGVFPYQLASSQEVKAIIKDVVGDTAEVLGVDEMTDGLTFATESPATPAKSPPQKTKTVTPAPASKDTAESQTLHSGAMLGELPALSPAPAKGGHVSSSRPSEAMSSPSKSGNSKAIPEGFPKHLLCAICERPAQDPVRSPYGGLFERKAILTWLERNGSVCPLTGQPLVVTELQEAPDIRQEVASFFEKPKPKKAEDDMYDF